jgi:hypothetical protein
VIALVKPTDKSPEERRVDEKRHNREGGPAEAPVTQHQQEYVECNRPADLAALVADVKALSATDFEQFKAWFRGYCGPLILKGSTSASRSYRFTFEDGRWRGSGVAVDVWHLQMCRP